MRALPLRKPRAARAKVAASFAAVLSIAVGGYFFPLLGFAVPVLIAAALAMNARSRRSFCAQTCPNGAVLGAALKPVSRFRRLPAFLSDPGFRRGLCGFMLFCVIGQTARGYPDASSIGRVFWAIYLIAVGLGAAAGLLYKPRAWCAFCPMGTLQDTVAPRR